MDKIKNRLGFQLLAIALVALGLGVGVYFAAQAIITQVVDAYLSSESVREGRLLQSADSLQKYVTEDNVELADKNKLDEWVASEQYVMLQIYRDGHIMYDSTMDEDMSSQNMAGGDAMQWHESFSINFADGPAQVVFYEFYHMQEYQATTVFSLALATIAFVITLLLLVRRKTRYVVRLSHELHILEGGDLEYPVTIRGRDELADLAQSIDDMRQAMIERQHKEEHMRDMNRELVTAMSHDLRSPLTSLIGYLDILTLERYKTEEERSRFLKNSRSKAYQIKEISDKLFQYFLFYDGELEHSKGEIYKCHELMQDLIEDNVFELRSAGFNVDYIPLDQPCDINILADKGLLRRAFDNLFINIKKYADEGQPVRVVCRLRDKKLEIDIANATRAQTAVSTGTRIGLKVAQRIFETYNGQFSYMEEDGKFVVTIVLTAE